MPTVTEKCRKCKGAKTIRKSKLPCPSCKGAGTFTKEVDEQQPTLRR